MYSVSDDLSAGFPHSEICGSMRVCSLPAAYRKLLRPSSPGIAHWFVMIGFVSLFGTLVTAYGQVFDPHFVLPIIGHWVPHNFLVELITVS